MPKDVIALVSLTLTLVATAVTCTWALSKQIAEGNHELAEIRKSQGSYWTNTDHALWTAGAETALLTTYGREVDLPKVHEIKQETNP